MVSEEQFKDEFLTELLCTYSVGKDIDIDEAVDFVIRDWIDYIDIGALILRANELKEKFKNE